MKEKVVVVCSGRGTYNKEELGYLSRYHSKKTSMIETIDEHRAEKEQIPITQLDEMTQFNLKKHTAGENASALIYACALGDFYDIDRDRYDIVAVTGNSMGWYIALRCAEVLTDTGAINLINTMGSMMQNGIIGGQVIYPVIDDNWQYDEQKAAHLNQVVKDIKGRPGCELYLSIDLGGYRVLGGNEPALRLLDSSLTRVQDRFPMRLYNHAAFHTPLLHSVSEQAKQSLSQSLFNTPSIPLIDGKGKIWQPKCFDLAEIYEYTLGAQVIEPYYFGRAVEIAVKEFAPDKVIVTGPGSNLGASVAQKLVQLKWDGMDSKNAFAERQMQHPYVISMGRESERALVVR
ncbi:ACP S-malonyltransferase [Alkalimarinus coralli]|uniref:ACP S-malonyltransferase n=1 Tax=Alkalimarinus coralli TaxID=2935863 RepID=UPI00202B8F1D|nr:ACP S-malonyltransferase [Alkalimarinus coralli]